MVNGVGGVLVQVLMLGVGGGDGGGGGWNGCLCGSDCVWRYVLVLDIVGTAGDNNTQFLPQNLSY
jgi:hypothetical protein